MPPGAPDSANLQPIFPGWQNQANQSDPSGLRSGITPRIGSIDSLSGARSIAGCSCPIWTYAGIRNMSPVAPGLPEMYIPFTYDECLLLCGAVVTGIVFFVSLGRLPS